MAWWGIVDDISGRLVSYGQDAELAPAGEITARGNVAVLIPRAPNWDTDDWDAISRTLVPRAPKRALLDLVAIIMGDSRIQLLDAVTRITIEDVLVERIVPPHSRYE